MIVGTIICEGMTLSWVLRVFQPNPTLINGKNLEFYQKGLERVCFQFLNAL